MCRTYDLATQTQSQGHTSRSCDLPLNISPQPFVRFSLNITEMLVCRTHGSAMQTQRNEMPHYAVLLILYNVNATLYNVEIAQYIVRTSLYMGVWLY